MSPIFVTIYYTMNYKDYNIKELPIFYLHFLSDASGKSLPHNPNVSHVQTVIQFTIGKVFVRKLY